MSARSCPPLPPDEVRSRAAGALGPCTALSHLSARRGGRRFAYRRDGQGPRAGLLLSAVLSAASEAGCVAAVHPVVLPDIGRTNIVPVDYVADALVELLHAEGRDGQTFHLTAPQSIGLHGIYRGIAEAAGLPRCAGHCRVRSLLPCSQCVAGPRCGATWRPPSSGFPRSSRHHRPGADIHLR